MGLGTEDKEAQTFNISSSSLLPIPHSHFLSPFLIAREAAVFDAVRLIGGGAEAGAAVGFVF